MMPYEKSCHCSARRLWTTEGDAGGGVPPRGGSRVVVRYNTFSPDNLNPAISWHGTNRMVGTAPTEAASCFALVEDTSRPAWPPVP